MSHQYRYIQFELDLDIIDDQFLEIIKEDIMYFEFESTKSNNSNQTQYQLQDTQIHNPQLFLYRYIATSNSIPDDIVMLLMLYFKNPIKYRWCRISPDQPGIFVYFYWKLQSNIDPALVQYCGRKRFGYLIRSMSDFKTINCPLHIPITELCMTCCTNRGNVQQYGRMVKLSVVRHVCQNTECQRFRHHQNIYSSDANKQEDYKSITDDRNHTIQDDPDKPSFQFQLILHQAFMKFVNPSIKNDDYTFKKVIKAIINDNELDIVSYAFKTKSKQREAIGKLQAYSNQLIREHKARKINNQMQYFHFDDEDHPDRILRNNIIKMIDEGKVSPVEWMDRWRVELRESLFDPIDLMKKLVKYKFNYEMVVNRYFRVKKLPEYIKGDWYNAIKKVMESDCDSTYRQYKSKRNATEFEKVSEKILDENGRKGRYMTESQSRQSGYKHKPDKLLYEPWSVICSNGQTKKIYWIDEKNYCCWITNERRYALSEQAQKYIDAGYGDGAFIFKQGFVENLNLGNGVVCISYQWYKDNAPTHVINHKGVVQDEHEADEKYNDTSCSYGIGIDNGEESADSEDSKDGIKSMRTYVPLPPISNTNSDKYNNNKRLTTKYSSNYDGDYHNYYNTEDHSMRSLLISEATLKRKIRRHNGTKTDRNINRNRSRRYEISQMFISK